MNFNDITWAKMKGKKTVCFKVLSSVNAGADSVKVQMFKQMVLNNNLE